TITSEFLSSEGQWRRARFIVSERTETGGVARAMYLIEDIDGSKIIALSTDDKTLSAEKAQAYIEETLSALTDIPVVKIEGTPDDGEGAAFEGLFVSKSNILLNEVLYKEDIIMEFYETKGQETDCEFVCAKPEFGFRALFAPYEIKRFYIDGGGKVTEKIR
ncbi:MAG: hypothetical protein IJS90_03690, partial [Clostridia bacterium]|nr:hypothetical protein [Clostridia bacterium]